MTDPFHWSPAMSVGSDELDKDHQELIALTRKCQGFIKNGEDFRVLHKVLTDLYEYTDYHFKREEALMEASGFPHLTVHKDTHEAMAMRVEEFLSELAKKGDLATASELLDFLVIWWRTHIMEMDQEYRPWVQGRKGLNQLINGRKKTL